MKGPIELHRGETRFAACLVTSMLGTNQTFQPVSGTIPHLNG